MGDAMDVVDPLNLVHSNKKKKKTKYQDTLGGLAADLYADTDPVRQALIARSSDFLSGEDIRDTPQYADLQVQTGNAFNRAKDNVIARTAPGGALVDALTNLESGRAQSLSSMGSMLQENELARAYDIATGGTTAAFGGLGTAAGIQAQYAANRAAVKAAEKQAMGQAAGAAAGGK